MKRSDIVRRFIKPQHPRQLSRRFMPRRPRQRRIRNHTQVRAFPLRLRHLKPSRPGCAEINYAPKYSTHSCRPHTAAARQPQVWLQQKVAVRAHIPPQDKVRWHRDTPRLYRATREWRGAGATREYAAQN